MTIALIAHDAKKELMVQFCIAYCGILSRYNLVQPALQEKLFLKLQDLKSPNF